jgi:hypothetical protein
MSAEEQDSLPTSNANVNSRSRMSNDTHEEGVDTNEEAEDMNGAENTSLDPPDEEGEPPADSWNLKTIYTAKDILRSNAVKCMGDKCCLVACSIWSSNLNPEELWFSCLGKLLCTIMCCIRLLHNIRDDISSTLPHHHAH